MMSFIKSLFGLSVLWVLTAACGNQGRNPNLIMPPEGSGYLKAELTPALQCSDDINVVDLRGDSSREYRACNPDSAGTLKIFPALGHSGTVCVFPASRGIPLFQGAIPVAKCGTVSSTGNSISFSGLNFDSVYVVKYEKYGAMVTCLNSNYPAACASSANFSSSYGLLK